MGERSRAIVRLVQPRIFSTSDVILCNFINTTSPLILNFSSDQKYFFLYRATPFFPAFAFMILSSIVSSPRLYLSLFSAKFWENCKHLLNSTLKKENNNYARYKNFKKTFVLKKSVNIVCCFNFFYLLIDRKMLNLKYWIHFCTAFQYLRKGIKNVSMEEREKSVRKKSAGRTHTRMHKIILPPPPFFFLSIPPRKTDLSQNLD